ncbi:MAG TPA: hypothetical protein VE261_01400 [Gaiellaceae bacterium]|nr:hypothetical protein [Gaiellaceae bacterium]
MKHDPNNRVCACAACLAEQRWNRACSDLQLAIERYGHESRQQNRREPQLVELAKKVIR